MHLMNTRFVVSYSEKHLLSLVFRKNISALADEGGSACGARAEHGQQNAAHRPHSEVSHRIYCNIQAVIFWGSGNQLWKGSTVTVFTEPEQLHALLFAKQ